MYITVRFGEKKEALYNPNCKCVCLLNTIKDKSQLEWNADIDLSDESGNLKNLRDFPNKYAADLLEDRETLILIKIDKNIAGETRFIPLLNDDTLTDTFYSQLASRNTQEPTSSRRNKSSKSRGTPTKELKAAANKTKAKPPAPVRNNSKNKNV